MIQALAILLTCQLAGEGLARGFGLPVPGPVIGLVLLFAGLLIMGHLRPARADITGSGLERVATGLLGVLGLLFVPAGVGVIQKLDLIGRQAGVILTALVVSTLVTLVVTVAVFRLVARWSGGRSKAGKAAPDAR